jgi:hypothetical protein
MRLTAILLTLVLGALAGVAAAADTPPTVPDPQYCSQRDADPEKCVIQNGPPPKPIVRKPAQPPGKANTTQKKGQTP